MVRNTGFRAHQQINMYFVWKKRNGKFYSSLEWRKFTIAICGAGSGEVVCIGGEKGIVFHRLINCVERILKFEYNFTLLLYLIQHDFDLSNTKLRNNLWN